MATELSAESSAMLQRYVEGRLSNTELEEWLVQVEYDEDKSLEEKDALAEIRLAIVDVDEERRKVDAILQSVATVLAASSPSETILAFRTGTGTQWVGSSFTGAPSRPRHVGISA